jgi:hypothetical protein
MQAGKTMSSVMQCNHLMHLHLLLWYCVSAQLCKVCFAMTKSKSTSKLKQPHLVTCKLPP